MKGLDLLKFGITLEQLKKIKIIIAFDLGHGESTCCYSVIGDNEDNEVHAMSMDIVGSQKLITALLKKNTKDRSWVLMNLGKDISPYQEVHVKFKDAPRALNMGMREAGTDFEKKYLLQQYVKEVLGNLKSYNEGVALKNEEVLLLVGMPSSPVWKSQDVDYAKIIREVSPYPVAIMPESRAALFKMIMDKKGESLIVEGVIVIDAGSSTMDWTYLYKNRGSGQVESAEDSINLGGGQVEDQMYQKGLCTDAEKKEKIKESYETMRFIPPYDQMPETQVWEEAEKIYAKKTAYKEQHKADDEAQDLPPLLMLLRAKKEQYFDENGEIRSKVEYKTKAGKEKSIVIDREFMEEGTDSVIHRPFRLTTKNGEQTQGWYEHCQMAFRDINKQLGSRPYKTIILTGGAAKMQFVQQLAKQEFKGARPEVRVLVDLNPSTCVARGMAYAGEMDVRATLALPEVMDKIMENLLSQEFVESCAKEAGERMKKIIYENIIWPSLQEWRDLEGVHTPKEAMELAKKKLMDLQMESSYQEKVKKVIVASVYANKERIIAIINKVYAAIYRNNIPNEYEIHLDENILRDISNGVVNYTFGDRFKDIILGALSFLGGYGSLVPMYNKKMDKDQRKKRVNRINEKKDRPPVIENYCRDYMESVMREIFAKKETGERLRNCMEPVVGTMLDELAVYFSV